MKREYLKRTSDAEDERKVLSYLHAFEVGADLATLDRSMGMVDDYMESSALGAALDRLELAGEVRSALVSGATTYVVTEKGAQRLRGTS